MEERKFSFEDLDAYKVSLDLVDTVYNLLKQFPNEERYALCDQLRRAVTSIPSNIAEGAGRISVKEKIHFLEIAFGSLMETYCQLQITERRHYITEQQCSTIKPLTHRTARLITGLRDFFLQEIKS